MSRIVMMLIAMLVIHLCYIKLTHKVGYLNEGAYEFQFGYAVTNDSGKERSN